MPNKNYREILLLIVNEHPKTFAKILKNRKEYQYLVKWINEQTPLLSDPIYTVTTKLYWILHDMVDFPICLHCGNKLTNRNVCFKYGYGQYCCASCQRHSKLRLEHAFQTNEKRHGSRNFNNKEKREATNLKKYGAKHNMQSELGMLEYRDGMQEKYGVDYTWQLSSTIEKSKQTSFEHFGVYITSLAQLTKDKQAETNLKKYGTKSPLQNTEVQEKTKTTMLEIYGVDHPSKSHEILCRTRGKYTYNGLNFDSAPEIAFYIWLIDNGILFEYQPKEKSIEYLDKTGKLHTYFPDFYLFDTNTLVEIKGDNHFDKNTRKMINISDRSLDYIAEAKQQCMLNNSVVIYQNKDYDKFVKYVSDKYGKNFLKSLKNSIQ